MASLDAFEASTWPMIQAGKPSSSSISTTYFWKFHIKYFYQIYTSASSADSAIKRPPLVSADVPVNRLKPFPLAIFLEISSIYSIIGNLSITNRTFSCCALARLSAWPKQSNETNANTRTNQLFRNLLHLWMRGRCTCGEVSPRFCSVDTFVQ